MALCLQKCVVTFLCLLLSSCAQTKFFGGTGKKSPAPLTPSPEIPSGKVTDTGTADTDKDGIPDAKESPKGDTNNNGLPDIQDADDDGDGIPTKIEGSAGQIVGGNGTGNPGNNGGTDPSVPLVPGGSAAYIDTDGDGIPNYLDPDDDNDGILTKNEDINHNGNPTDDDTDGDGLPNYLDPDDDNDGKPTKDEDTNNNGNPNDDDNDQDDIPNYLDPQDNKPNDPGQILFPPSKCTGGTKEQKPVFCKCLSYDANRYPIYVDAYNIWGFQEKIIADFVQHAGQKPNYQYQNLVFMKENFHEGKILQSSLYKTSFCMQNYDVSPRPFSDGFPYLNTFGICSILDQYEYFALDTYAKLLVPHEGTYQFMLVSDDGAQLYLDGVLVADNDGLHAPHTVYGSAFLTAGEHRLRIKYFQGPKYEIALQLFWRNSQDSTGFTIVPRESFHFSGKF